MPLDVAEEFHGTYMHSSCGAKIWPEPYQSSASMSMNQSPSKFARRVADKFNFLLIPHIVP